MVSLTVDSIKNIAMHTVFTKYLLRMKLLFTVSDLIEAELDSKFCEFFELACYALNQRVAKSYHRLRNLTSRRTIPQSLRRKSRS